MPIVDNVTVGIRFEWIVGVELLPSLDNFRNETSFGRLRTEDVIRCQTKRERRRTVSRHLTLADLPCLSTVDSFAPGDASCTDLHAGIVGDVHRVLSTAFQRDWYHFLCCCSHHNLSHGRRARVEDLIDIALEQCLRLINSTEYDANARRVQIAFDHVGHDSSRSRRQFRWFENGTVACSDRANQRSQCDEIRVVPGANDQCDTQWFGMNVFIERGKGQGIRSLLVASPVVDMVENVNTFVTNLDGRT